LQTQLDFVNYSRIIAIADSYYRKTMREVIETCSIVTHLLNFLRSNVSELRDFKLRRFDNGMENLQDPQRNTIHPSQDARRSSISWRYLTRNTSRILCCSYLSAGAATAKDATRRRPE